MFKRKTVFWKHVPNIRNINMFINGKYFLLYLYNSNFSHCFSTKEEVLWIFSLTRVYLMQGSREQVLRGKRWDWNIILFIHVIYFTSTQVRSHSLLKLRTPSPSLLAQVKKKQNDTTNNKYLSRINNRQPNWKLERWPALRVGLENIFG